MVCIFYFIYSYLELNDNLQDIVGIYVYMYVFGCIKVLLRKQYIDFGQDWNLKLKMKIRKMKY